MVSLVRKSRRHYFFAWRKISATWKTASEILKATRFETSFIMVKCVAIFWTDGITKSSSFSYENQCCQLESMYWSSKNYHQWSKNCYIFWPCNRAKIVKKGWNTVCIPKWRYYMFLQDWCVLMVFLLKTNNLFFVSAQHLLEISQHSQSVQDLASAINESDLEMFLFPEDFVMKLFNIIR